MKRRIGTLALAASIGALAGSCLVWSVGDGAKEGASAPAAEEDRAQTAARKVLELINDAWKAEDGAPLMREALAEQYVALLPNPRNPAEFRVVGRDRLVELFAEAQRVSRPLRHEHRVSVMKTTGNVVYEIGVSEHVARNGARRKSDVLNVLVEGEDGWKLLFSANARDVRDAVRLRDKLSAERDE